MPANSGRKLIFSPNRDDPDQTENDHLRSRIAELEQVVRELRQKGSGKAPSTTTYPQNEEPANKKRKVIVDRFAKFRYDEVMRSANGPSLEDQGTSTSLPIHPTNRAKPAFIEDHQEATGSSRKTSMSEDPGQGDSRRNSLVACDWKHDSRRSSKDHLEEPYIANIKGEGDSLIGDAAGRKAYVYELFPKVQKCNPTDS
jgi:hypothetical protein